MTPAFVCSQCLQEFPSAEARNGHIGAAHVRARSLKDITHGTTAGYRAHKRRGEEACATCKRAWRGNYQRKLKG